MAAVSAHTRALAHAALRAGVSAAAGAMAFSGLCVLGARLALPLVRLLPHAAAAPALWLVLGLAPFAGAWAALKAQERWLPFELASPLNALAGVAWGLPLGGWLWGGGWGVPGLALALAACASLAALIPSRAALLGVVVSPYTVLLFYLLSAPY